MEISEINKNKQNFNEQLLNLKTILLDNPGLMITIIEDLSSSLVIYIFFKNIFKIKDSNAFSLLEETFDYVKNAHFEIFQKEFDLNLILNLIPNCNSFECMALLIENFCIISNINQSQIKTIFHEKIRETLDDNIQKYEKNQIIKDKLYCNYQNIEKNINCTNFSMSLEICQKKIKKVFEYLIYPYLEKLKNKESLIYPLLVWIMLMPINQVADDYRIVMKMSQSIIKILESKKSFYLFNIGIGDDQYCDSLYQV